jgi:hypothetical protein
MRLLILIQLLMQCAVLHAQHSMIDSTSRMHGLTWVFGVSAAGLKFTQPPPLTFDTLYLLDGTIPAANIVNGYSNICDTSGELAFFTSAYFVFDRTGHPMHAIHQPINTPLGDTFFKRAGEYSQMSICLPKEGSQYYVITGGLSDEGYLRLIDSGYRYTAFHFDVLSYAVVDMDSNAGLGALISKNTIIDQAKWFAVDRMTAVRHGNGRDWWLVRPHKTKIQFYTYLVTADTIQLWDSAIISADVMDPLGSRGQCAFSPDGKHFAMARDYSDTIHRAHIADFDRCSGTFSNYHKLTIPIQMWNDNALSVCFSPDSKLLYVGAYEAIFQGYTSDTTGASMQQIIGHDTTWNFPWYQELALGPDGKLYIGNFNNRRQMSYIDKPNERGLSCNLVPLGLRTVVTPLTTVPNMPNYALGRYKGSPCDTIYNTKPPPAPVPNTWALYPNPTSGSINIAVPDSAATSINLIVHNALGQKIASQVIPVNAQHIAEYNLQYAAKGMYFLQVRSGQQRFMGKVVVGN